MNQVVAEVYALYFLIEDDLNHAQERMVKGKPLK